MPQQRQTTSSDALKTRSSTSQSSQVTAPSYSKEPSPLYLCAGGTGGHLFPAIATARLLKRNVSNITLLSDKKIEEPGITSLRLSIPRRSNKKKLPLFILALITTFFRCLWLFWKTKPELVVGFGGYPSVPPLLAAQLLKIPTLLHEQNAVLGRANRMLIKRTSLIATSFNETKYLPAHVPHIVTGNPVRIQSCSPYNFQKNTLHIAVIGGSQGAAVFSTLIPEALNKLSTEERARITLTQQCRPEFLEETRKAYDALGMAPTLKPFFEDMQELYESADFIIARSGASTVSEVTVACRPALLVPYPYAMDNHQLYNAKAIGDKACFVVEQKNITAEKLAHLLRDCLQNPDMLKNKAQAIHHQSMAAAASHLARVIGDLLSSTAGVAKK